MSASRPQPLLPVSLRKDGADRLLIAWSDGHQSVYTWQHLREQCPCAGCREERERPPDPFRVLSEKELAPRSPLAPLAMAPVGHYAYKITWNDGHDTGIFTLDNLRRLCECPECRHE
jgi:DUF971 family protein